MTDELTLAEAIRRVKRRFVRGRMWHSRDVHTAYEVSIARIINAVVAGDLAPADDKDATIARLTADNERLIKLVEDERAINAAEFEVLDSGWKQRAEQAEAKLAEVTAELEAIKGRKVAAIINGDGPMTVQKSTIRKLVEERDTARSAGTFAQGIEAAVECYENGFPAWDVFGEAIRQMRALSPTPQADPVREAALVLIPVLSKRHDDYMRAKGRNPADYHSKWRTASEALEALAQKEPTND